MHKLRKVLSILLCVAMLLSVTSIGVFAEDVQEEVPVAEEIPAEETSNEPESVPEAEQVSEAEEDPEPEQAPVSETEQELPAEVEEEVTPADESLIEEAVTENEEAAALQELLKDVVLHVSYDEENSKITLSGLPEGIESATCKVYNDAHTAADGVSPDENGECSLSSALVFGEDYTVAVTVTIGGEQQTLTAAETIASSNGYITVNIPYDTFYGDVVGLSGSVDVVSSATSQKAGSCKNVWFASTPVMTGETTINGVTFPATVSRTVYDAMKADDKGENAAWHIAAVLEKEPAVYTTMQTATSVSGLFADETESSTTAELLTGVHWGDYEINLASSAGIASANVYGAYIVTSDGAKYALRQSANLWTPSSYYECAWVLSDSYYASTEGKTVTGMTFITKNGIVNYSFDGLYVIPQYKGSVTATLSDDGMSIKLEGLPEDIADAKVTVSAGGRQKTYVAQNATIDENGTVALTALPIGADYTVQIACSNYATITVANTVTVFGALINIPYNQFYTEIAGMSNGSSVDTVSSATTGKVRSCSNVWFAAEPTISTGTDVKGIVFPVKMDAAAYNALKESVTSANEAYYISGIVKDAPAVYSVLTYKDGSCSFAALTGETVPTSVAAEITSDTVWGDYQITLSGVTNTPADVYGVYLTTEEGNRYAMKQAENLWTPRNYSEIAFSVGNRTSEPHGGILTYAHTKGLEGKTVTKATFIMKSGIIEYVFRIPQRVAMHYTGTISAQLSADDRTVTVTGMPYYISNPQITVATDGRPKTYLVQKGTPENGTVGLTASPAANTKYTVTVTSDNYAAMTCTVTTGDTIVSIDYPASLTLGVGETVTETPVAVPVGAASEFTFATSNNKIVVVDAATGEMTAKKTGTATITVTGNDGITAECVVKVVKAPSSVSILPKKSTIAVGMELTTTAKLTSSSASRLTYTSSDETVATVDENGIITGVSAGTAKITVKTFNNKKATATITVKPVAEAIVLNKSEADLTVKKNLTLKPTFTASDAYSVTTWTSSDASVASVNSKGVVTAKKVGTATITAATFGGASATCEVRVWAAPTGIALNEKSVTVSLAEMTELQLTATVKPLETANPTVTFLSSNKKIATVSDTGLVTFTGKTGKVNIVAVSANGKKATCKITVTK